MKNVRTLSIKWRAFVPRANARLAVNCPEPHQDTASDISAHVQSDHRNGGGQWKWSSSSQRPHLPGQRQRSSEQRLQRPSAPGIFECRDLKTGELIFNERVKGPGPTGSNWSSLVLTADGKCYAANQGGDIFVLKASPKFELLATNSLGERFIGSIAVSDGKLFIRGYQNLWCIGKR